ncbi:MAG: hypothetical protein QNL11_10525 [Desulfobacterales bacterium]|nr:hypothetical protein [Desulfobacterales bacterium]
MPKKSGPQTRFVDRPEVSETFADSIHGLSFDGQSMRIEFCTTRLDSPQPPSLQRHVNTLYVDWS